MVLSSRDRRFGQRRDSSKRTIRESAAACVSLSNSTMSKTRTNLVGPTRLTPGGRRRRLSRGPPRPCQPDFSVFSAKPGKPRNSAQKSPRGILEVFPRAPRRSIEGPETTQTGGGAQAFSHPQPGKPPARCEPTVKTEESPARRAPPGPSSTHGQAQLMALHTLRAQPETRLASQRDAFHQLSIQRSFFSVRTGKGGSAFRPDSTQRRVSAGSITSSSDGLIAWDSAFPRA